MSQAREPEPSPERLVIRNATPADIDAVYAIAIAGKLESWTRDAYLCQTSAENTLFLVAEKGKICGFAVVGISRVAAEAEIQNIAVNPDCRRRGIASHLIAEIAERLAELRIEKLFLEVRASNFAAIRAYEKCGFEVIGRRPGFYSRPAEDALLMRKLLTSNGL